MQCQGPNTGLLSEAADVTLSLLVGSSFREGTAWMPDLNWRDAIVHVLKSSPEQMHYTAIAEAITEQGLRKEVGATPASTVNATISMSLQNEGEKSPFVRASRGHYGLRPKTGEVAIACTGLHVYWTMGAKNRRPTSHLLPMLCVIVIIFTTALHVASKK